MINSLFIYFSLMITSVSLNFIASYRIKFNVFILFSFYILFMLLALRFNIGTDYQSYRMIFDTIASTGTFPTEYGFLLINKIVIFFDLPFEVLVAICSFLTLLFIYKSSPRKYLAMIIFLYIASNSYFQSMSLIRQSLAIAIALYAVTRIYQLGIVKYFLWILFATSFHLSAILFLPFYFLKRLNVNYLYAYFLIIWTFIVTYTSILEDIFMNIISLTPYGIYIGGAFFNKEIAIGSGLGVLFRILIGFVILLYSKQIKSKFPNANIYLLLLFIYEIAYISALKIYIFNRLADTFSLFFIFIIPYFIDSFGKQIKIVLKVMFALLFLVLMYKNLSNDYYQKSGGIGVVPYVSIFN